MNQVTDTVLPISTHRQETYYLGISLAVLSSVFIGSSFIIKKLALIRLANKGSIRAGAGGYGYISDWFWWFGFLMLAMGELSNFAAYIFAPASLITPLGALSILVSSILASKFLSESLPPLAKIGCLLCIFGAIVFVIHAPKGTDIQSFEELTSLLHNTFFIYYVVCAFIFIIFLMAYAVPKYGTRYVWVYISICSVIGSFTVLACKMLGIAIKEVASGDVTSFTKWNLLVIVSIVLMLIVIQMSYLNKALDLFSTSIVQPIYYVMFTIAVIVASGIFLQEWKYMMLKDSLGTVGGFVIITAAIYLLSAHKDCGTSAEISTQPLLRRNHKIYMRNV